MLSSHTLVQNGSKSSQLGSNHSSTNVGTCGLERQTVGPNAAQTFLGSHQFFAVVNTERAPRSPGLRHSQGGGSKLIDWVGATSP